MVTRHQQPKPSPHRRLTVTTAAGSRLLTTTARVKQSLGVEDDSQDSLIAELIARVSDEAVEYLRLPTADDGTVPTLARETYVETIRDLPLEYELFLTRRPVASVTSVVVDGTTLVADTEYQVNSGVGTLNRLSSDAITSWSFTKAVITYVAGYLLPAEDNRTLPYDIEEAVIYAVTARMADLDTTGGDMEIRSESLDGVYSASYQTQGAKRYDPTMGLPQRSIALLAKYRTPMI